MKKFRNICLIILVAVFVATFISSVAASFVDVPKDAYYAEAAERMAARNILSGYGDGYYYGSHNVNRGQVAALVCKILGKVSEATALAGKTSFADVPETHWATGYINYAVANGIISGDGDGNFRPEDNVKYEEVIKVIVCILDLDEGIKIDPKDWSKEYIEAAKKAGLLSNLIGKKGEPMVRSDIAVICDAAMNVLDAKEAETSVATTTKKPASTTRATKATTKEDEPEEPVETTAVVTTEATTTAPEETTIAPPEDVVKPEETTVTYQTFVTTKVSTWTDENGFPMGDNYGEWV